MRKEILQILNFINRHPLAGRHRFKAYRKLAAWQVSQFLRTREQVVPFVGETKLAVKKGLTGATGNIYTGLHEFTEMAFLLHFLREGDLFADIGANVGSYTVLAAGVGGARVMAFEPVPETFEWLQKNIILNHLQQTVKAFNIGLGSEHRKLRCTATLDTVNHIVLPEGGAPNGTIEVQMERLDVLSAQEGVPQLVKIDVEGYETEVVEGMAGILASPELNAIIIELNGVGDRFGFDEGRIRLEFERNGFFPCRYDPFTRSLQDQERCRTLNTIYVRDISTVQNRLQAAAKFKVFSEEF